MSGSRVSALRLFYWSLRRELWENRSIYLAPAAGSVLIMLAALVSAAHFNGTAGAFDQSHGDAEQPYVLAALLLMFITLVVALYYCLESFQSERRDRSILFWKSMPVSDAISVAAKASIPVLILPLLTFGFTAVTQLFMLLVSRLAGAQPVPLLEMWEMLLYHLVAGHGLWYAPVYGWLFLVSAWARRAPLLWAVLPLLVLGLAERIAFNTSYFATFLAYRIVASPVASRPVSESMSLDMIHAASPAQFLASPAFWLGLLFFAGCLAASTELRRRRDPA